MLQDAGGIRSENGLDIRKLAAVAGTHHTTTKRLFDGTTLFPHYRTVWCNLAALGYRMSPVERSRISQKDIHAISPKHKKRKKKRRGKRKA